MQFAPVSDQLFVEPRFGLCVRLRFSHGIILPFDGSLYYSKLG